jgi:hypothetical protein
LKAFAGDDLFIHNTLSRKNPMDLESFASFFKMYPQHSGYYNIDEVASLGDLYVGNMDELDLGAFMQELTGRKQSTNFQKAPGFAGIHQQGSEIGIGIGNERMPGFSSTNTKTATEAQKVQPTAFRPHMLKEEIHEIMKTTYICNMLVQDYFHQSNPQKMPNLKMVDFETVMTTIAPSMNNMQVQSMFRQIDEVMNS